MPHVEAKESAKEMGQGAQQSAREAGSDVGSQQSGKNHSTGSLIEVVN